MIAPSRDRLTWRQYHATDPLRFSIGFVESPVEAQPQQRERLVHAFSQRGGGAGVLRLERAREALQLSLRESSRRRRPRLRHRLRHARMHRLRGAQGRRSGHKVQYVPRFRRS